MHLHNRMILLVAGLCLIAIAAAGAPGAERLRGYVRHQTCPATMLAARKAVEAAPEVTDERHVNTKTGSGISSGDAMQMGLVTADGVHWNVGAALTRAGVAFHQWEGRGDTLLKTVGCAVVRDDKAKATRYELRLPLAALGLKPGDEFGSNIVLFDSDGDDGSGQRYWLQLAPGLVHPSTPSCIRGSSWRSRS